MAKCTTRVWLVTLIWSRAGNSGPDALLVAIGVKRTSPIAVHMSANDPKRTSLVALRALEDKAKMCFCLSRIGGGVAFGLSGNVPDPTPLSINGLD